MAGKPIVRSSARVGRAIDALSKNALADLVLDFIQGETGDGASDDAIFAALQPRVDTILRMRGDKSVSLAGLAKRFDGAEARYLEQQSQRKQYLEEQAVGERVLAEKVRAINAERLHTHNVDGTRRE